MPWLHALTFIAFSVIAPLEFSPVEMRGGSWLAPVVWLALSTVLCVVGVWRDPGGHRDGKHEVFWTNAMNKFVFVPQPHCIADANKNWP
jgi:hypothetical protein